MSSEFIDEIACCVCVCVWFWWQVINDDDKIEKPACILSLFATSEKVFEGLLLWLDENNTNNECPSNKTINLFLNDDQLISSVRNCEENVRFSELDWELSVNAHTHTQSYIDLCDVFCFVGNDRTVSELALTTSWDVASVSGT